MHVGPRRQSISPSRFPLPAADANIDARLTPATYLSSLSLQNEGSNINDIFKVEQVETPEHLDKGECLVEIRVSTLLARRPPLPRSGPVR